MKKNILFVDEQKEKIDYFINGFNKIPGLFQYVYACSAEKGLNALKRQQPDLVFAHYQMPEINGLLFLSAIKGYRKYDHLRVFLYGDTISEEESKMAKRLGAAGCLEKTTDNSALTRQLKAILDPELLPRYVFFTRNEITGFTIPPDEIIANHTEGDVEQRRDSTNPPLQMSNNVLITVAV